MSRRSPTSGTMLFSTCLRSTPSAFTYCLMCDGYFISHGIIHFSVPESTRQNVSAQEAAEEVDAKEAAEKEKEGEELRRQPKPRGEFGKVAKSSRMMTTRSPRNPTRGVISELDIQEQRSRSQAQGQMRGPAR